MQGLATPSFLPRAIALYVPLLSDPRFFLGRDERFDSLSAARKARGATASHGDPNVVPVAADLRSVGREVDASSPGLPSMPAPTWSYRDDLQRRRTTSTDTKTSMPQQPQHLQGGQ